MQQAYNDFQAAFLNLKTILENDPKFLKATRGNDPHGAFAEPYYVPRERRLVREKYSLEWQQLFEAVSDFRDALRYLA